MGGDMSHIGIVEITLPDRAVINVGVPVAAGGQSRLNLNAAKESQE